MKARSKLSSTQVCYRQPASLQIIRELSKVQPLRAQSYIALDWVVIMLAGFISYHAHSLFIYLCSILIIGARQHALLIIVHEGAHYRLSNSRNFNDLISDLFAAFPIFFCTNGYRTNHLQHHQYLNTDGDPDWKRKIHLREWQFPQVPTKILGTALKVLTTSWYTMMFLFWNLSGIGLADTWKKPDKRQTAILKIFYYALAVTVISLSSWWRELLWLWLVPFFTVMPLIERVRSISEHFGLEYECELSQTRNILCSPLEAFFFGPHNIRYHLDHHLFPTVPQYNLPRLHSHLTQFSEFSERAHTNFSYIVGHGSVLNDIIN